MMLSLPASGMVSLASAFRPSKFCVSNIFSFTGEISPPEFIYKRAPARHTLAVPDKKDYVLLKSHTMQVMVEEDTMEKKMQQHNLRAAAKLCRLVLAAIGVVAVLSSGSQSWALPTVPPGFTIALIATENPDSLHGIQPGQGDFGNYLYYILYPNEIWRVRFDGSDRSLFAKIDGGMLANLSFGFGGDLYAVDGQWYVPSKIYRIKPDGSSSLFSAPAPAPATQSSESMVYGATGPFGNNLFISEFDNCMEIDGTGQYGNPINSVDSSGARNEFVRLANGCNRLTGLAFGPGGGFGTDLFAINTNNGVIYKVAANGSYSEFSVSPSIGGAETLAFGSAQTLFGERLFVAKDFSGEIYQIDPEGHSSLFASGFTGFNYAGVTGLRFSEDRKKLFVTDDNAGAIYVISLPTLKCVGFEKPLDDPSRPVRVSLNRTLPFKAQLFDDAGAPVAGADLAGDLPLIQVMYDPGSGESVDVTSQVEAAGHGADDGHFVFTEDNKWQFNLKVKSLDGERICSTFRKSRHHRNCQLPEDDKWQSKGKIQCFNEDGIFTVTMKPGIGYDIDPTCRATFVIK
jgi:hypothetical protein